IRSENPRVIRRITWKNFRIRTASQTHLASGVFHSPKIAESRKVYGESNLLVDHQRRIFEKELAPVGPDRCPERFGRFGLRRWRASLRAGGTGRQYHRGENDEIDLFHGRTSSPTTRSNSTKASLTAACKSSSRRRAARLTRSESSNSRIPTSPS